LDVDSIGEEHDKSINTETPTSSGRKTVFQGLDEIFINGHGFFITLCLFLHLGSESLSLIIGIVQLSESITDFVIVDEKFESFGETGQFSVVFSQGGHEDGVFSQESGVKAVNFDESTNQLIDKSGGGVRRGAFNLMLLGQQSEEFIGFRGGQILR